MEFPTPLPSVSLWICKIVLSPIQVYFDSQLWKDSVPLRKKDLKSVKRKKFNQITFDILMQQKLYRLCCKKEPSPVLSNSSLKINLSRDENPGQGTKIPEFYSRSDPGFSWDFCTDCSVTCAFDFYWIISKFGSFLV